MKIVAVILALGLAILAGIGISKLIVSRSYEKQELYIPKEWPFLEKDLFHKGWKLVDHYKAKKNITVYTYTKAGESVIVKVNKDGHAIDVQTVVKTDKRLLHNYRKTLEENNFELLKDDGDIKYYYNSPFEVMIGQTKDSLVYSIYYVGE
jgi:hypothetical protein